MPIQHVYDMKNRYKIIIAFLLLSVFVTGIKMAEIVNQLEYECSPFNNNVIDSISFIVALIAFVFSAITYFSIDAVNSITSMNGNVLENPYYTITTASAIQKFSNCKTYDEYENTLFNMVKLKRHTTSCIAFADEIQCIIDNLIWFHDIEKNAKNIERMNCLVKKLRKEEKKYSRLSNSINYLLDENIKLIEYNFQFQIHRTSKELHACELENVRGEMLINPVARIIYYDYVALDYSKQARRLLDISGKYKDFSLPNLLEIYASLNKKKYNAQTLKKIQILVERANSFYEKAMKVASENLLWEGYILCNTARSKLHMYLLNIGNITMKDVNDAYDQVINVKTKEYYLCFIDEKESYLKQLYNYRLQQMIEEKEVVQTFFQSCQHEIG